MNLTNNRVHIAIAAAALLTQVGFAQEVSNSTVIELDEIKVITAIGVEQNIADAPATITIISGEELQKKII